MMKNETLRVGLVALLVGATGLTLIKLWTDVSKPQSNTSLLPEQINLQGWKFKESHPLNFPSKERLERITSILERGHLYQYQQGKVPLKIELWTIQNTNGDVSAFIDAYAQQPIPPGRQRSEVRYRSGVGFYGITAADNRLYLSSCINTTGESTFTISQFTQARFQRDFDLSKITGWLLEQGSLFQKQCVWSHLSIPSTAQKAKEVLTLEGAWFNWQKWWRLHYPFPK
jgi:cyanosortase A-associated protein